MFTIPVETEQHVKEHFVKCYPEEGCGFILKDYSFVPCKNVSSTPQETFEIADQDYLHYFTKFGILAVVHSHPGSRSEPTACDMRAQIKSNLIWGLCTVANDYTSPLWFWGSQECVPPLKGRPFRHGPSGTDGKGDCYALIRDYFLLERGIELPEFPRDNNWWLSQDGTPLNLYDDYFSHAGFKEIKAEEAQVGDVCFMRIGPGVTVNNHACIIVGHNLFLHHLTDRPSREEAIGRWDKFITKWVRYDGCTNTA